MNQLSSIVHQHLADMEIPYQYIIGEGEDPRAGIFVIGPQCDESIYIKVYLNTDGSVDFLFRFYDWLQDGEKKFNAPVKPQDVIDAIKAYYKDFKMIDGTE